jgi:hypothetical protein
VAASASAGGCTRRTAPAHAGRAAADPSDARLAVRRERSLRGAKNGTAQAAGAADRRSSRSGRGRPGRHDVEVLHSNPAIASRDVASSTV